MPYSLYLEKRFIAKGLRNIHYNPIFFLFCRLLNEAFPLYLIKDKEFSLFIQFSSQKNFLQIIFSHLRFLKGGVEYSSFKEMSMKEIYDFMNSNHISLSEENNKENNK